MKTIGIIGGGNMGMAIIEGIRRQYKVLVCEKDSVRSQELKKRFKITTQDLDAVIKKSKIVILAVKPQDFDSILSHRNFKNEIPIPPLAGPDRQEDSDVTPPKAARREIVPSTARPIWEEMAKAMTSNQLVISIAAGITTQYIEKRLGNNIRVIRTMPNLPAQVGKAVTALCKGSWAQESDIQSAQEIFKRIGKTVVVEESLMDAVTAVSGSGPAYVFYFLECFQQAALSLGLNEETSQELVIETLKGSLALLEKSKEEAGILRKKVTSKGGTTEAALAVLEQNKFAEIFARALAAARDRARELAK